VSYRAPGLSGSGSADDRLESVVVTGVRSDGDVNSLGADTVGGAAIGAGRLLGVAFSGIAGGTTRGGESGGAL
jgi:hypothetical protein